MSWRQTCSRLGPPQQRLLTRYLYKVINRRSIRRHPVRHSKVAELLELSDQRRHATFGNGVRCDLEKSGGDTRSRTGPSPDTRIVMPEVPCSSIAGLRNIVVYEYFGVNPALIANIVDHHLEGHLDQLAMALESHSVE